MSGCGNYTPFFGTQIPSLICASDMTQDQFNASVITAFKTAEINFTALQQQLANDEGSIQTNNANIAANKTAITQTATNLQNSVADLQSKIDTLNASFQSLSSDNATFKSNITTQIQQFQALLDTFNGQITALQNNVASNTARITKLENIVDPSLWSQMVDAFNNMQKTIDNAITQYDTSVVQPALAKETSDRQTADNNLSTQITAATSSVATLSAQVAQNAKDASQAISNNTDSINQEISRAKSSESNLDNLIITETTRAQTAETNLQSGLTSETQRAEGVEQTLQTGLTNTTNLVTDAQNCGASVVKDLVPRPGKEVPCQLLALSNMIDAETERAEAAEGQIETRAENNSDSIIANQNRLTALETITQKAGVCVQPIPTIDTDHTIPCALAGLQSDIDQETLRAKNAEAVNAESAAAATATAAAAQTLATSAKSASEANAAAIAALPKITLKSGSLAQTGGQVDDICKLVNKADGSWTFLLTALKACEIAGNSYNAGASFTTPPTNTGGGFALTISTPQQNATLTMQGTSTILGGWQSLTVG